MNNSLVFVLFSFYTSAFAPSFQWNNFENNFIFFTLSCRWLKYEWWKKRSAECAHTPNASTTCIYLINIFFLRCDTNDKEDKRRS